LPVEGLGPLPAEPVVGAHLVRAVVRTVPRAHAAVVDLAVQAIRRVVRGVHGTDRLARRIAALLAHHRQERRVQILAFALEVALDAHPVEDAPLRDLLRADDTDVVLGVACGDAGTAAGAPFHVDGHAPARLLL